MAVVGSVVAAVTAIGSIMGGAALTAEVVGTIAAGIGMAGMALSVVGGITGNSGLSKLGGELGLVGGIGSLGAGIAGSIGSTAASQTVTDAQALGGGGTSTMTDAQLQAAGVQQAQSGIATQSLAAPTGSGLGSSGAVTNLANAQVNNGLLASTPSGLTDTGSLNSMVANSTAGINGAQAGYTPN